MKKLILSIAVVLAATFSVNAQEHSEGDGHNHGAEPAAAEQAQPKAAMEMEKTVHDYGTVVQGGDGTCEFKFTNTSSVPLVIKSARGSCGCTVPEWPKEPIAPGATSVITVKYDTKRLGPINKSVTIVANTEPETIVLRIKGDVVAPADNTPVKEDSDGAPVAQ